MFDHEEEDKDLDSQVAKGQSIANDANRGAREETPGPEALEPTQRQHLPESTERESTDTSSPNTTENSDSVRTTNPKIIPESALPDKIVTSPSTQEKE